MRKKHKGYILVVVIALAVYMYLYKATEIPKEQAVSSSVNIVSEGGYKESFAPEIDASDINASDLLDSTLASIVINVDDLHLALSRYIRDPNIDHNTKSRKIWDAMRNNPLYYGLMTGYLIELDSSSLYSDIMAVLTNGELNDIQEVDTTIILESMLEHFSANEVLHKKTEIATYAKKRIEDAGYSPPIIYGMMDLYLKTEGNNKNIIEFVNNSLSSKGLDGETRGAIYEVARNNSVSISINKVIDDAALAEEQKQLLLSSMEGGDASTQNVEKYIKTRPVIIVGSEYDVGQIYLWLSGYKNLVGLERYYYDSLNWFGEEIYLLKHILGQDDFPVGLKNENKYINLLYRYYINIKNNDGFEDPESREIFIKLSFGRPGFLDAFPVD